MPITIKVDNVGAKFMENMKPIVALSILAPVFISFVNIEEGGIKIVFVKTEDNTADPFTKNVTGL
jgi:hypothetical protein